MDTRIVMVFLLFLTVPAVAFSSATTGADNGKCLSCHGNKQAIKKGNDKLYINPATFGSTTHSLIGCSVCHDSVSRTHPTDGSRPSRANCKDCHAPTHEEYSQTAHFNNASCNDCHNPHEVKPALFASGDYINAKCNRCHDVSKTLKSHSKWLTQADLHLSALPCITCHTSSSNYVIVMTIQNKTVNDRQNDFKAAGYEELQSLKPINGDLSRLIDTNGDGFISLNELRAFNHEVKSKGMRLWGMMMPETVTHSYQIIQSRWDCSFCHASGPKAMQTSYVAFPDKGGNFSRMAVEKGAVLDLLYGTPDFYMLGSTRSKALNIIGALIIIGGMMMPIGHGTFRFLTRKNRKGQH